MEARTAAEISAEIESERASGDLSTYIGDSDKFFESLRDSIAVSLSNTDVVLAQFIDDVDVYAAKIIPTSAAYWAWNAAQWQEGDELALDYDTGGIGYSVDDDTKKIVVVSAYEASQGGLVIKVAKYDDDDNLVALSAAQLASLQSYIDVQRSFPITCRSIDGDSVYMTCIVYVDPKIISITDGSSINDASVFPLIDEINDYFETYAKDAMYDDEFRLVDLQSKMSAVSGVKSFNITSLVMVDSYANSRDVLTSAKKNDTPTAGYYVLANTTGITYQEY